MISTGPGTSPPGAKREGEQKEWYYRLQTYKEGKVKGKPHYLYNWPLIDEKADCQKKREG